MQIANQNLQTANQNQSVLIRQFPVINFFEVNYPLWTMQKCYTISTALFHRWVLTLHGLVLEWGDVLKAWRWHIPIFVWLLPVLAPVLTRWPASKEMAILPLVKFHWILCKKEKSLLPSGRQERLWLLWRRKISKKKDLNLGLILSPSSAL